MDFLDFVACMTLAIFGFYILTTVFDRGALRYPTTANMIRAFFVLAIYVAALWRVAL